ncbi:unnamed protein product, partial [Plutella xylostella]
PAASGCKVITTAWDRGGLIFVLGGSLVGALVDTGACFLAPRLTTVVQVSPFLLGPTGCEGDTWSTGAATFGAGPLGFLLLFLFLLFFFSWLGPGCCSATISPKGVWICF